MKTKLLVDGDVLVYRLGFAAQSRNKDENGEGIIEPARNALHMVKKCIGEMSRKFDTKNIKVYLTSSDKSNFRFKLATIKPYKGSRDKALNPNAPDKPHHYNNIRRYLIGQYNTEVISGMEADDAMGIHQMKHYEDPYFETIICTIDKDLDMIPGKHYNFVTGELYESKDPGTLTLSENRKKVSGTGLKWFYAQCLAGDKADDIPGLKGFGPVKVYETLKDVHEEEELWHTVQKTYLDCLTYYHSYDEIYARLYEVVDLLWMWRKPNDCKSAHLKSLGRISEKEITL